MKSVSNILLIIFRLILT